MKKSRPSDIERTARAVYDYLRLHPEVVSNKAIRNQLRALALLMELVLKEEEQDHRLSSPRGRRSRRDNGSEPVKPA